MQSVEERDLDHSAARVQWLRVRRRNPLVDALVRADAIMVVPVPPENLVRTALVHESKPAPMPPVRLGSSCGQLARDRHSERRHPVQHATGRHHFHSLGVGAARPKAWSEDSFVTIERVFRSSLTVLSLLSSPLGSAERIPSESGEFLYEFSTDGSTASGGPATGRRLSPLRRPLAIPWRPPHELPPGRPNGGARYAQSLNPTGGTPVLGLGPVRLRPERQSSQHKPV